MEINIIVLEILLIFQPQPFNWAEKVGVATSLINMGVKLNSFIYFCGKTDTLTAYVTSCVKILNC